jgi:hypothetical protein
MWGTGTRIGHETAARGTSTSASICRKAGDAGHDAGSRASRRKLAAGKHYDGCMRVMHFLALSFALATGAVAQQNAAPSSVVPEISADLGSCTADFNVSDMAGKPIYAAKVHTLIRYGFLNKRKTELEAYTNADGKVRFVRLPDQSKEPILFDISNQADTARISYDPSTACHGKYDVPLRGAGGSKGKK